MSLKDTPKAVVDSVLVRKVAALAIAGAKTSDICRQLNLTRYEVKKITEREDFQQIVEQEGDREITPLINRAKADLARLVNKSIKVVERHLEKDNLEAAKIVLRSVGLEKAEAQQADTQINVILPTGVNVKDVAATVEVNEDEPST